MNKGYLSILKGKKGAALIIALLIMAVLALIGQAALMTSFIETKISGNIKTSRKAFYTAEAGLDVGRLALRRSFDRNNGWANHLGREPGIGAILNDANGGIYDRRVGMGNQKYSVYIRDNDDGDGDPARDLDNAVILTSIGSSANSSKTVEIAVRFVQFSESYGGKDQDGQNTNTYDDADITW